MSDDLLVKSEKSFSIRGTEDKSERKGGNVMGRAQLIPTLTPCNNFRGCVTFIVSDISAVLTNSKKCRVKPSHLENRLHLGQYLLHQEVVECVGVLGGMEALQELREVLELWEVLPDIWPILDEAGPC